MSTIQRAPDDWKRQVDFDFDFAKQALLERGRLFVTLILHGAEHSTVIIAAGVMDEDDGRLRLMAYLKLLALADGVKAISFLGEAWIRKLSARHGESEEAFKQRALSGPRPSQAEDRREIVFASIFWRDDAGEMQSLVRQGEIQRDGDATITGFDETPLGSGAAHYESPWSAAIPPFDLTPEQRTQARALADTAAEKLGLQALEITRSH
jgi:hypothetical protein